MSATAVIAVSGVRSSWDTSPANCLARASIRSSWAILPASAAAMVLSVAPSRASSSRPRGSSRTVRSPPDMACAACASRPTGDSTRRVAANARPVITVSSSPTTTRKNTTIATESGRPEGARPGAPPGGGAQAVFDQKTVDRPGDGGQLGQRGVPAEDEADQPRFRDCRHHHHHDERDDQAGPHEAPSLLPGYTGPKRYPKPRTVWTYRGPAGSASILARSRCTHAS